MRRHNDERLGSYAGVEPLAFSLSAKRVIPGDRWS